MSGNNKNTTHYSSLDIQKYLRGELSAPEMNALEKAALEDPFLADAIEGIGNSYSLTGEKSFEDGLDDLKKRLDEKIAHKNEKAPIPLRRPLWMAAASVLLLAGLGTTAYFVFNKTKGPAALADQESKNAPAATPSASASDSSVMTIPDTTPVPAEGKNAAPASAKKSSKTSSSLSDTPPKAKAAAPAPAPDEPAQLQRESIAETRLRDTVSVAMDQREEKVRKERMSAAALRAAHAPAKTDNENYVASNTDNRLQKNALAQSNHGPRYNSNQLNNNVAGNSRFSSSMFPKDSITVSNNGPVTYNKDLAKNMYYETDKYLFTGKVIDENNLPITGATLFLADQPGLSTVSDNMGLFHLNVRKKDTAFRLVVNSVGYESASMELNTDNIAGNIIQLKPHRNSLDEVVVVGYGSQKKTQISGFASPAGAGDSASAPKIIARNVQPAGGWQDYKDWLGKNWRAAGPDSARKGKETLSFSVNKNGSLSNFTIERSISPARDSVITSLIRQGPSWILRKGKKGRVTVTVSN